MDPAALPLPMFVVSATLSRFLVPAPASSTSFTSATAVDEMYRQSAVRRIIRQCILTCGGYDTGTTSSLLRLFLVRPDTTGERLLHVVKDAFDGENDLVEILPLVRELTVE